MLPLSPQLQSLLEQKASAFSWKALAQYAQIISERYRNPLSQSYFIQSSLEAMAYLMVRFPATYAVISHVIQELQYQLNDFTPNSLLDIGSGPGTVLWASDNIYPEIKNITLLENNIYMRDIGKYLIETINYKEKVQWQSQDITNSPKLATADLVFASYILNEISPHQLSQVIQTLWQSTQHILIIIEPGTPKAYQQLLTIRSQLIDLGGYILAPCPHHQACPVDHTNWCHFSLRIPRSKAHIYLKQGNLPFEDEKYTYLIISREKPVHFNRYSRIIFPPKSNKFQLTLPLCTADGEYQLENILIRDKQRYKKYKKAQWGESIKET